MNFLSCVCDYIEDHKDVGLLVCEEAGKGVDNRGAEGAKPPQIFDKI